MQSRLRPRSLQLLCSKLPAYFPEYEGSMACTQFAEHRYYGESKPFPEKAIRDRMQYLTAEQV